VFVTLAIGQDVSGSESRRRVLAGDDAGAVVGITDVEAEESLAQGVDTSTAAP
jgi:hypothetical protein